VDGVFFCVLLSYGGSSNPLQVCQTTSVMPDKLILFGKVVYDIIYAKQFVYPLFNEFTKKLNNLCETNSCAKQHCMTPEISHTRIRIVYVYDIDHVLLAGVLRTPFRFHVKHYVTMYDTPLYDIINGTG